jgi:lysophospholipase L1-like esterase
MHIVMLGDSIFDNKVYVNPGEPDVRQQLTTHFPHERVTLLAVDGDVIASVDAQLRRLPADTTHLVLSVGGNDLLGQTSILMREASSVAAVLLELSGVVAAFEQRYRTMLEGVLSHGLPLVVCTVYNPNEPDELRRTISMTALALFNDAIIRVARRAGVPVVELRDVCSQPEDFANPIEPSAVGGEKIAIALAHVLNTHDFSSNTTILYA